ncbi:MAG: Maf family nucleotide pyrophosphatase [Bacteroidales bacterium]|nr:Maf family nucleotide pyrophosphatase [Bacteroidales bacterium]
MLENLDKYDVILASKSPRRQELLAGMGVKFRVMTRDVVEDYPPSLPAVDVPAFLSRKKASAFEINELPENYLVIASDTVVIIDNQILGKPKDTDDATRMLRLLSGQTHKVVSGVTIKTKDVTETFSAVSDVTFNILNDNEIHFYIEKYRPFDKAGAYGVQEWIGYIGVSAVKGSFYNVMGLPTQMLYQTLKKF